MRIEDRFWSKVQKGDGCWLWTASARNIGGYGQFSVGARKVLAHVFSWQLANGEVPVGLCVLHTCDNPRCVNPDHLWLGTQTQNMADKVAKGRHRTRSYRLRPCDAEEYASYRQLRAF